MDSYPAPQERMLKALAFLREREIMGATWFELGEHYGWHHGQSSAVLSTMHREGRISRLTVRRGKSYVYVDNFHVHGRETGQHGRKVNDDNSYLEGYLDGMEAARSTVVMVLSGVSKPIVPHNDRCWQHHPACALNAVIHQISINVGRKAA